MLRDGDGNDGFFAGVGTDTPIGCTEMTPLTSAMIAIEIRRFIALEIGAIGSIISAKVLLAIGFSNANIGLNLGSANQAKLLFA